MLSVANKLSFGLLTSLSKRFLLNLYEGAAAAYSLQRLSSDTTNVVRVRESVGDTEANFTAQQVSGGALREFALQNDADLIRFANQASATDKRMYFDGVNDSISLTSGITLNSATNWRVDFTIMLDGVTDFAILGDPSNDGIYFQNSLSSLTITGGGAFRGISGLSLNTHQIYNLSLRCDGTNIDLFDITNGGSSALGQITVSTLVDVDVSVIGNRATRWAKGLLYDVKIDNTANDTDWVAQWNGYGNTNADWEDQVGSNDGTVSGSPALFSGQGFDAYVTTLYDQSGNGRNATQATAASQPQIVADGLVVTDADGIPAMSFDGVNDKLGVSGETIITGDSTGEWSAFSVQEITTADIGFVYGNTAGGGAGTSLRIVTSPTSYTVSNATSTADYIARGLTKDLVSTCYNNGDAKLKLNGGGTPVSGSYSYTAATLDFTIGDWPNSSVANSAMLGKISEIVIYASDQSANRAAIESKIAERYGITLA